MSNEIRFSENEKTRLFGVEDSYDRHLCSKHAEARRDTLGVPQSGMAIMMGMIPWPTGREPCDDCEEEALKVRGSSQGTSLSP